MSQKKELTIEALTENLQAVLDFVDAELDAVSCPVQMKNPLDLAVEELYLNISTYSYDTEIGTATVRIEVEEDPIRVVLTFVDQGIPFDPLAKPDPTFEEAIEDRPIGGLGIFMVKNSMDEVHYEYRDGQNILTLRKSMETVF